MRSATQAKLNSPYGDVLIDKVVNRSPGKLSSIPLFLDEVQESDLINIGTGAFSPLNGFMNSQNFLSVCRESVLRSNGLPWTIPIVLDVDSEEARRVEIGTPVLLISRTTNAEIGYIVPEEVFKHDKSMHKVSTFGTVDLAHPGVARVEKMKDFLLAGEIFLFREALSTDPLSYPAQVREFLTKNEIWKIAGFQTRNVVHRAHEYLQRVAIESVGAVLVHPVVGWKKRGDFRAEVVKSAYEEFIKNYYPEKSAVLAFLKLAMRYAGPREAVFHAIVRKNYGCSHFIVGRDHAGVGDYYERYAGHKIFDSLPHLGIEILRLFEPFYCEKCDSIASEKTCGHGDENREYISGTKIRKILNDGADPRGHIFRGDVLKRIKTFSNSEIFYE